MKCKYCNADIEQGALFCTNCGKDLSKFDKCVKCGELLERKTAFCPHCGAEQPHHETNDKSRPKKWLWLSIILACLALAGIGYWFYSRNQNVDQYVSADESSNIEEIADTIENDPVAVESALSRQAMREGTAELEVEESLQKMLPELINASGEHYIPKYFTHSFNTNYNRAYKKAMRENCECPKLWWQYSDDDPTQYTINGVTYVSQKKVNAVLALKGELYDRTFEVILKDENDSWLIDQITEKNDTPSKHKTRTTNTSIRKEYKNYGYSIYQGPLSAGKPHGVNGKMLYKRSHLIDSRDPKGRVAEPGDYVIGEFYEGHLVQGIWYDSNNQVKGSILIGR